MLPKTSSWNSLELVLVVEAGERQPLLDSLLPGEHLDDAVDRVALELLVRRRT